GSRAPERDVFAGEPDLLLQFTVQRLFDRFTPAYAPRGNLRAAATGTLAEESLAVVAHQHDSDIGAIPLCVDPVAHESLFTGCHAAEQGRCTTMSRDLAPRSDPAILIPVDIGRWHRLLQPGRGLHRHRNAGRDRGIVRRLCRARTHRGRRAA